jgi:signal transduction histidine kinase
MDQLKPEETAETLNLREVLRDCLTPGIIVVDLQGRICACNQEGQRWIRAGGSSLIGHSAEALPSPLREIVEAALRSPGSIQEQEIPFASDTLLHVSHTVCTGPDGMRTAVVLVIHDITAAHRLDAHMQRLDRLASIGTVSASMAHEIKNALVAVSTFVQDLAERNQNSELAGVVSRELRRIDTIVSQILRFGGPAKPTFTRLSVHRILDESLRLVQAQLESKQLRLRRALSASVDWVNGDEYQLEQAFLNILLNAVAAMEAQGQLSVATGMSEGGDPPGASLWIAVSDTGEGIAPEALGHIFEPFFSTKPHGTGLGLAITRRIIVEHGGSIDVESELRKGTTFRITLPLAQR